MADETPTQQPSNEAPVPALPTPPADDLGIDREFIISMARIPFIAVTFVFGAYLSHVLWAAVVGDVSNAAIENGGPKNLGPLVFVSIGMIVAAVIDGIWFKVPNWLTLSLVVSGWMLDALHTFGVSVDSGIGSHGASLWGTFVGFMTMAFLLPLRGMGQGDIKMTMGFGSWLCAFYGAAVGFWVLLWAFLTGVLVGGILGIIVILIRREFYRNWQNTVEIYRDMHVLVTAGAAKAAARAEARHGERIRLPYGVPLCIGFLTFLIYIYVYQVKPSDPFGLFGS